MTSRKQVIPWASEEEWTQVVLSMSKTIAAHSDLESETATIRTLSKQIIQVYKDLEPILERACLASCPTCPDVCCRRATVWYDLKDLLTIFLNTGGFPDNQISRRDDNSCCNLTPSGCRLKRSERPFICTWYICPEQKKLMEGLPQSDRGRTLFGAVNQIKILREALEQEYVKAICA